MKYINKIINGILNFDIEGYKIYLEYEASVDDDIIDVEYTLLNGITETEIVDHIKPNISKSEFNEYVSFIINKIKFLCELEVERKLTDSYITEKEEKENYGDYLYHKMKDNRMD
jgi:hypothetical protein